VLGLGFTHIHLGSFFLDPEDIRGPCGTVVKEQEFFNLVLYYGAQRPSFKA